MFHVKHVDTLSGFSIKESDVTSPGNCFPLRIFERLKRLFPSPNRVSNQKMFHRFSFLETSTAEHSLKDSDLHVQIDKNKGPRYADLVLFIIM